MTLEPGKTYQSEMTQTLTLRGEDTAKELAAIATLNIDNCFELNEQQWNAQQVPQGQQIPQGTRKSNDDPEQQRPHPCR